MTTYNFDKISIISQTENTLKSEELTQIQNGEIALYKLTLKFDGESSPKPYSLIWEEDQIDIIGVWHSKIALNRNITPDWNMRKIDSRTASGMPLLSVYNKAGENRISVALSDTASPASIMVGVVEENAKLRFKIDFFEAICPKMSEYEVIIRIDRRKINASNAIKDTRSWWLSLGSTFAHVPENARLPMYSTWYSFHQHTIPEDIIRECEIAKKCGMDTVIVDDGWQTDDNSRGYAFCGDWKICKAKIPDMKDFVDKIHALGMKFIIWFSVPYVGFESENYEKFKGMYLNTRHLSRASVLDPRFKEVREFLVSTYCNYVKEYGWDGLKLDFIDSFALSEESSCEYDKMDTISLEVALEMLLDEITVALKKINPEILIEFRQSYIGPIVSKYGNMFRVTDCPNDAIYNRVGSLDLRLTSGKIPVHSDMLMWHKDDTLQSVAYQLYAIMFSVPQISVKFDNISCEQAKLLNSFLSFWRENQRVILDGDLIVQGIDFGYTMAKTTLDNTSVCVLYEDVVATASEAKSYIFNSTGRDKIAIELDFGASVEIYDIFGSKYDEITLNAGIHRINAKNCEMIKVIKEG